MTSQEPVGYVVSCMPADMSGRLYLYCPAAILRWTDTKAHGLLFVRKQDAEDMVKVAEKMGLFTALHIDRYVLSVT